MTDPCSRDPRLIDALRDWAWERGRTDIVLDLDLHATAWAFHRRPSRENLVAFSAVIPRGGAPVELARDTRHLALAGGGEDEVARLAAAVGRWCPHLCRRITAELREMAADADPPPDRAR